MEDKKYAVLIDGDNISYKYLDSVFNEINKYGVATYKRIYCDFTRPQAAKWRKFVKDSGIQAMQQFNNTVGKNATDSTLIIDAMDILYSGNVDGFCIVSSDGDFTRLAIRLRESGMDVIGMGENKTPRSFRAACTVFADLELIYDAEVDDNSNKNKFKKSKSNLIKVSEIENIIIETINENSNKGRITGLGEIGSRIQKRYNDFDVRQYGYSSLSTFIDEIDGFVLRKDNNNVYVELREDNNIKNNVIDYIVMCVNEAGANGMDLGALGQRIHSCYPNFKVKEYGYSTLLKFISATNKFNIEIADDNRRLVHAK